MTTNDETIIAFQRIAAPLWVLDRLEQRQAQLHDVPDNVMQWVAEWQRIRADNDSVIDGRMAELVEMTR